MTRNLGFDRTAVLADACRVFWQLGYSRTSMRNITEVTGLNPGSIYNHFGNKEQLFLLVCDYYYKNLTTTINKQLDSDAQADDLLASFFMSLIGIDNNLGFRGCLLVNSLLECSYEPDIQAHIAAMFSGFEEMFYWLLIKGQQQGCIRPGLDIRTEAKSLVTSYYGLRVQSLTELTTDEIKALVTHILQRLS